MANQPVVKKPSRPTIDTVTGNVGPHAGVIDPAGLTNDPRPLLSGHGDVGSIIHVRVEGREVGMAEVGSDGTWTYQLQQPLPDGLCSLSARASNSAGQSVPSKTYMIEVDVTAPPPPVIDHVSSDVPATLSGHAQAHSTVDVYDGKTLLGTVTAGADGQWTFLMPAGIVDGKHVLTATASDLAGNASEPSSSVNYHPTTRAVVDLAGRDNGEHHNDWLTNDGTAGRLISGHIEGALGKEDRVQISTDGGRTWQDALMKAGGKWVASDPNAHTGNWTIQTRVMNAAGEPGKENSTAITLKTSTEMPTSVSFDGSGGTMTVKFSPEQLASGSKLLLRVDGSWSEHVLSAPELAAGVAMFDAAVQGAKQVSAAVVDTAGNISSYRDDRGAALDAPIEQALTGTTAYYSGSKLGTTFTVADVGYFFGAGAGVHGGVGNAGVGNDELDLTGANQVLDITALNSGATDKISNIEVIKLMGSGNNTLRISVADVLNLGRPDAFRPDGYSQMRVAGNSGDRVELAGIPDLTSGGWVTAGTYEFYGKYIVYRNDALKAELFVRDGVAVSHVLRVAPVIDSVELNGSPSVSGHADAQAQVAVYDGDTVIGTVTAGTDGTWTLALPNGMQPGLHTLMASVTDISGVALKSVEFAFDVTAATTPVPEEPAAPEEPATPEEPTAPEEPSNPENPGGQKQDKPPSRPTIDTVTDNVEPHTGTIPESGLTNDPRPVLRGHGEAGSIIHVRVDNNEVGTVRVGSNGIWTYQLPDPLPDGLVRLSVRASNSAGQSVPSKAYIIEVDVTPPPPPTIDQATSGTPATLSGHAEPYSTVDVYDGKTFLGTVTTGADSQWTLPLPSGMSVGHHPLTATARDPAGNVSQSSADFDFVVEPEVPTARAVLDNAGRDSGVSHSDWLTNDGTAGRLIGGHIEGVLGANDRVQISTDGGRTWQDALMKSNGKWVAIDPNAHTGNWTIQTRVVNTAGEHGEQDNTAVTLKTSTAMPAELFFNSDVEMVVVRFLPEQVAPDWKLSLMIDGRLYEHVLSQQEVASGAAGFYAPVKGAKQVVAATVDTAGNISSYRGTETVTVGGISSFSENFESLSGDTYLSAYGARASTRYFEVTGLGSLNGVWQQGLLTGRDVTSWAPSVITEAPTTRVLSITGRVRLDLHEGLTATRMAFDLGDMTTQEVIKLYFYDANGSWIYTSQGYSAAGGVHQRVDINVGRAFARVEINAEWRSTEAGMSWVDNITFTGSTATTTTRPVIRDPLTVQMLDGNMAYYGGSRETLFTVNDVSYFSGSGAGAHGGVSNDTLQLRGANQVLDITAVNSGATDKISGIEVIDLTGSGDNTLRISTADVLNLGHPDAFRQDGYSQMRVTGNAGDRVELAGIPGLAAGGWTNAGNFVIGGAQYVVYRNDALKAELFVNNAVAVSGGSAVAPVIDSVVLTGTPSVSGHAGAQAQVTVYDGTTSIGTVTAGTDGAWSLPLPKDMQAGTHTLTASVTDAGGLVLTSPEFTFDYGGTISRPAPSTRSLAALFGGMEHDTGDGNSHVDHGTGNPAPKLTLADVLNPGHHELFRADGSAQVPGMPEPALASNDVRPMLGGVGYAGAHHAAQEVDLMAQSAMYTMAMA